MLVYNHMMYAFGTSTCMGVLVPNVSLADSIVDGIYRDAQ